MFLRKFFTNLFLVSSCPLVGGQAVIEGVMMRNKERISCVVRKKNGDLEVKKEVFISFLDKYKFLKLPFLRGFISLFELMFLGVRLLMWSANIAEEEEEKKLSKLETIGMIALSFVWVAFLFILLPLLITFGIKQFTNFIGEGVFMFNFINGIIKIVFFITYLLLISLMPDVRRVFEYHGAEHKAIFTFENKKELTTKNAKKYDRFHPRCGTSFLVFSLFISVIIFSLIPLSFPWYVNFLYRIIFVPIIIGVGYEVLRFSAKFSNKWWMKVLIWPGLQTQRITTREPDEEQLEVGLEALRMVIGKQIKCESKESISLIKEDNLEIQFNKKG